MTTRPEADRGEVCATYVCNYVSFPRGAPTTGTHVPLHPPARVLSQEALALATACSILARALLRLHCPVDFRFAHFLASFCVYLLCHVSKCHHVRELRDQITLFVRRLHLRCPATHPSSPVLSKPGCLLCVPDSFAQRALAPGVRFLTSISNSTWAKPQCPWHPLALNTL